MGNSLTYMKTVKEGIQRYLQDESNCRSSNIESVLVLENKREIAQAVKGLKGPFTVFGGGTGIVGGVTAEGGSVISTEKLKKISIDPDSKKVVVECGVLLEELHKELKKHKFWWPVDSTEQTATIGGNIATNAWGTRSFKYGSIRGFVRRLDIVLPDGSEITIKRGEIKARGLDFNFELNNKNYNFSVEDLADRFEIKNSSGYFMEKDMDLIDLFIGSEGTLGIVSEIELSVLDAPYDISAFMVPFDDKEEALDFIELVKSKRHG